MHREDCEGKTVRRTALGIVKYDMHHVRGIKKYVGDTQAQTVHYCSAIAERDGFTKDRRRKRRVASSTGMMFCRGGCFEGTHPLSAE
jgi:hypothetical protein